MTSFLTFTFFCYGLSFLIADAKIFGCPVMSYLEDPLDHEYIKNSGIIKIRQHLLKLTFFRELFGCYFCLGVWVGVPAHLAFYYVFGPDYFLYHDFTTAKFILSITLASLVSATASFILNNVVVVLEKHSG